VRIIDKFQLFLYNLRTEGLAEGDKIEIYLPKRLYEFLCFELVQTRMIPEENEGGECFGIELFDTFRIKPMQEVESMRHALQEMASLKRQNISLLTQLAPSEDD
jgi:hypothetical protein